MIQACICCGLYDLHVRHAADADLDGEFTAVCLETGDTLTIRGWMIESYEVVNQ